MNSEIYAADSDQQGEDRGGHYKMDANRAGSLRLSKHQAERQLADSRNRCVPARKAQRRDLSELSDEIGTRSRKGKLEKGIENGAAQDRRQDEQTGATFAYGKKERGHNRDQQCKYRGTAQCGDVSHNVKQPWRPDWPRQVGRMAKGDHQPTVERDRLSFGHFQCDERKTEQKNGDEQGRSPRLQMPGTAIQLFSSSSPPRSSTSINLQRYEVRFGG
jgi:hypothetical protein